MGEQAATTIEGLAELLARDYADTRCLVALAGPPGTGKTTAAASLETLLAGRNVSCQTLPMDGFHYDNMLLDELGTTARKGAPFTFDVAGLEHMLERLRANTQQQVCAPVFDRDLEIARAGARMIEQGTSVILVEGNYLLLDQEPWQRLHELFDVTVMLTASEKTLRERLTQRWIDHGLDDDGIRAKLDDNDLPNGQLVMRQSRPPDFRIDTG